VLTQRPGDFDAARCPDCGHARSNAPEKARRARSSRGREKAIALTYGIGQMFEIGYMTALLQHSVAVFWA
jgi:hypothetical protein